MTVRSPLVEGTSSNPHTHAIRRLTTSWSPSSRQAAASGLHHWHSHAKGHIRIHIIIFYLKKLMSVKKVLITYFQIYFLIFISTNLGTLNSD